MSPARWKTHVSAIARFSGSLPLCAMSFSVIPFTMFVACGGFVLTHSGSPCGMNGQLIWCHSGRLRDRSFVRISSAHRVASIKRYSSRSDSGSFSNCARQWLSYQGLFSSIARTAGIVVGLSRWRIWYAIAPLIMWPGMFQARVLNGNKPKTATATANRRRFIVCISEKCWPTLPRIPVRRLQNQCTERLCSRAHAS